MASCMLCIWITCKVITTVLANLKENPCESRSLWNNTWLFISSPDAVQTKERMTCCSPFYERRWWVSTMMNVGLCFAQIMCAMCLFSVPAWASIPWPTGAGCGTCSSERPALQASLSLEPCQPGDYRWTNTYAARDWTPEQRASQHDDMDVPLPYPSARLWIQAEREGSCSLQQGRTKGHTAAFGAWGRFLLCSPHKRATSYSA